MFRTYIVAMVAAIVVAAIPSSSDGQESLRWVFPGTGTLWQEDSCQVNQLAISAQYNDLLRERLIISTPATAKTIYRGEGKTTFQKVHTANALQSSNTTISWMMPVNSSRRNDYWGVRIRSSALGYNYAVLQSEQSTLSSETMSREFLYSMDSPFLNSRWFASLGTQEQDRFIWSGGLDTRPLHFIELSYRHRSNAECYRLGYEYDYEPIDIPLAFTTSSDWYRMKLTPRRGVRVEGVWNITWLDKETSNHQLFQIDPRVEYQRGRAMLFLQLHPMAGLGLGWNYSTLAGSARLLYQDIWCGKISMVRANLGGPMAQVNLRLSEHRDLTLEWERVEINGELSGHLEFWPFTPTLVDLLGLRRYYHGWCEIKGYRYSGSTSFSVFRNLRLVPLLQVVDAIIEARFNSWRPAWLVFGKEDERISHARIHRLEAALIHCNLTYPLRWVTVTSSIQQWIPIRTIGNPSPEFSPVPKNPPSRGLVKKPVNSEPFETTSRISAGGRLYTVSMSIDLDKALGR